ncbi:hypothetical protein PENSPDRAFT_668826 [Peniophora sp. CONT]|nr:hypothetical protein PENSPDRAFT_668826 [Peniophora sp. CONT]
MSIAQFPAEVLEHILLYWVYQDPPTFYSNDFIVHALGWLSFIHVCRRWRLIALECGRVWAAGYTHIPHRVSLVASRAKCYPRYIELSLRQPAFAILQRGKFRAPLASPDILDDILTEGNLNLVHTIICTDPHEVYRFAHALVAPFQTAVADKLRLLELETSCFRQQGRSTLMRINWLALTRGLLCPSLERVTFRGVWIPVISGVLRQMAMHMEGLGQSRPSIKLLSDALLVPHASQLQCLGLYDAFKRCEQSSSEPVLQRVDLERLVIIDLRADVVEASQFFSRFSLPRNVEIVRIALYERPHWRVLPLGESDIEDVLSNLESLHRTCDRFRVFLQGELDEAYSLVIDAWRKTSAIEYQSSASLRQRFMNAQGSDFTFTFGCDDGGRSWESVLCCIVNALACGPSDRLSLVIPPPFYMRGRSNWGYLACHLNTIGFVSPYASIATAGLRHDDTFVDWISRLQDLDSIS